MKTKNIFKITTWIMFLVIAVSCVDNNDYSLPQVTVKEPDIEVNSSISSVITTFKDAKVDVLDFGTDNLVIEGYIVSSDEAGNMYKILSIQDKPENPTAAIQLAVDATDMYSFYNVGRKVYVKLNGLGMHNNNGVLEIGKINKTSVDRIPLFNNVTENYILRSAEVANIIPQKIESIKDLNDTHISMLIQLDNIQTQEKNQTYANPADTFNVNRMLKSCADDATIIMRNSGFADFKAQLIPNTKGTITAVVGKYKNDFQLFIRDTNDINFTENRCEPLFEENFSASNFDQWTLQNVTGSQTWEIADFGNPKPSAKISGFSKNGAKENEDWLISKAINLSEITGNVVFTFESVKRYSGIDVEVYYSTNYNGGNPNDKANIWTKLPAIIDTNVGSWTSWTFSGNLDVSDAIGGNLFIAFKYMSTTSKAATFEIDNIKIEAK